MRMSHDMGVLVVAAILLCGLWPGAGWGQGMSPDQAIRLYQHMLRRNPPRCAGRVVGKGWALDVYAI